MDLTGMKINKLEVVEKAESEIRYYENLKRNKTIKKWLCKCECGNYIVVNENSLLYKGGKNDCGNCVNYIGMEFGCFIVMEKCESKFYNSGSMSQYICKCKLCGNLTKKTMNNLKNHKHIKCEECEKIKIGEKFGRLEVIDECEPYLWNGNNYSQHLCRCECGNTVVVRDNGLKSGKSKSCGCYQKDKHFEASFRDLTNENFGNLIVKNLSRVENGEKNNEYFWLCDCDCGNYNLEVKGSLLKSGRTKSCGCLSLLNESRMAIILKQVLKHEFKDTKWEYDAGFRTNKNGISKYDIYVPEINLLIECQSEYHDDKEQSLIDVEKRMFALEHGYEFMEIDCRDYEVLDIIKTFVPTINEIPEYIKYDKKSMVSWDLGKAQELLNMGYSQQRIADTIGGTSRSAIGRAIKQGYLTRNTLQNQKHVERLNELTSFNYEDAIV